MADHTSSPSRYNEVVHGTNHPVTQNDYGYRNSSTDNSSARRTQARTAAQTWVHDEKDGIGWTKILGRSCGWC